MDVTETPSSDSVERRNRANNIEEHLTDERADMLVQFCRIAGVDPWDEPHTATELQNMLQEFCEILVDYLAAGHFGLYQRFIDGEERRDEIRQLAEKLYPQISETTQMALDFNDKYEIKSDKEFDKSFSDDLSKLGQALAVRIELEDQLLNVTH
ncbi:MAG: Rsd/AlgQ family anti-sigma factor [Sulfuriflexus sp.]|nr:Rsd/AlgQ family anti-sigma factor [Sulfuriflexus sp.]